MKIDFIEIRTQFEADYIIENNATIRETAIEFGVSKTTTHVDVTERLKESSPSKYMEVMNVLNDNKEKRSIRGGMATKRKFEELNKLKYEEKIGG